MSKPSTSAPTSSVRRRAPGLIIAAPNSGSGKTTISLALMRALSRQNARIAPAKVGPDYIDPGFHRAACGIASINLDPWGMRAETRAGLISDLAAGPDLVLVEGVMGLFDGALDGSGSTADLAAETGWPVLLVVDVKGQAGSAAAVVRGFASHREDIAVAGVVFNRCGGPHHRDMLRQAMTASGLGIPVLGCLPKLDGLHLESRHLGLVQARERADLEAVLDRAADWIARYADLTAIAQAAGRGVSFESGMNETPLPPLGQRIALARDDAFDFTYSHILSGWRRAGVEILPFSPLANQAPDPSADAIYLPGGYPELHAGRIAGASAFLGGLRAAAERGVRIFGECGGYMVLGERLIDADGEAHAMAGLLTLTSSFEAPKRHLGYRRARVLAEGAPWPKGQRFTGHEFHYATVTVEEGQPLFQAYDALGENRGTQGLIAGSVSGSFLHLIDRAV